MGSEVPTYLNNALAYLEGRRGDLVINIKVHGYWLAVPKEVQSAVDALPNKQRYRLLQRAEEDTREEWWSATAHLAKELVLPSLYTTGRSGGWLIVGHLAQLVRLIESAEESCAHCTLPYSEHVSGKCLFEPTRFKVANEWASDRIAAYVLFASSVKKSLEDVPSMYADQLSFQLEHLNDGDAEPPVRRDATPDGDIEAERAEGSFGIGA